MRSAKRKCLAVGLSLAITCMTSLPVLARAYVCDVCGVGMVSVSADRSNWAYAGTTECSKIEGEKDPVYVQVTDYFEECSNSACGVTYSYSTSDYEIRCSH